MTTMASLDFSIAGKSWEIFLPFSRSFSSKKVLVIPSSCNLSSRWAVKRKRVSAPQKLKKTSYFHPRSEGTDEVARWMVDAIEYKLTGLMVLVFRAKTWPEKPWIRKTSNITCVYVRKWSHRSSQRGHERATSLAVCRQVQSMLRYTKLPSGRRRPTKLHGGILTDVIQLLLLSDSQTA